MMDRFLPLPLPCRCHKYQHSDQCLHCDSSYSNSFLPSQSSSLHSLPSLTPHSQTLEHATSSSTATTRYHCLATLKGHSSYIFSLALADDHLYSGGSNGEIRVWDRNPSSLNTSHNYTVSEGYSAVKFILVSGDELFTAHHDHRIRIWKIDNSAPYQKYKLITTLPTVNDRCMRLFSAKSYVQVRRHKKCMWVCHVDTVSALVLSSDSSLLYSVSWDRTLKVWRTSDFKCIESVQNAHDDAINAVVLSGDGRVYTCSADKTIKVWERRDAEKKHSLVSTLEKHKSAVNALALSGDGSTLYSGACDRKIIAWENEGGGAASWAVAGALRGHKKAVLCLAVVSDVLCSGSADRTVRIWRRGSRKGYSCLGVIEGHTSPVKCLTACLDISESTDNASGNSYLVYSGGLDFDIKVWRIRIPL